MDPTARAGITIDFEGKLALAPQDADKSGSISKLELVAAMQSALLRAEDGLRCYYLRN